MSVQELSSQMGISLPKAYELVKQPGFPVLRIGTRILIPVDSFNAWLNRKAEGGEKDGCETRPGELHRGKCEDNGDRSRDGSHRRTDSESH